MQGIMFDRIQSLDKSRTNWRLKARVTRFWPTTTPETAVIRGYNMILLDNDNSHIHAYVYPDNWRAIGKEVVEGMVYTIENFQVRDTIGRLKPVSNKNCIRLLSSTRIEPADNDPMIPLYKFEFLDLGDLPEECCKFKNEENPEFAVDLIGAVEGFVRAKRVPTRFGERDQLRFKLSDGSVSYKVTVWGDLANSVSDKYVYDPEKTVIGIMTSAKLSIFRDEIQIGALPSTKIYLNLDIEPVMEFRERLVEDGYKTPEGSNDSSSVSPANVVIERTSFKDLSENSLNYTSKRAVLVTFTVVKVEEEDNWWYNSCISCHSEVEKIEKKFKCSKCARNFPYSEKRFRILVLADDTSLATNVILLDRVVKRMVGNTVANILNEMKKVGSTNVIPDMFKQILGKEVTVVIELSESNISGDSNLYEAVDFCDSFVYEKAIVEVTPTQASSSFSVDEEVIGIELFKTPESSSSVAKKIKMEDSSA